MLRSHALIIWSHSTLYFTVPQQLLTHDSLDLRSSLGCVFSAQNLTSVSLHSSHKASCLLRSPTSSLLKFPGHCSLLTECCLTDDLSAECTSGILNYTTVPDILLIRDFTNLSQFLNGFSKKQMACRNSGNILKVQNSPFGEKPCLGGDLAAGSSLSHLVKLCLREAPSARRKKKNHRSSWLPSQGHLKQWLCGLVTKQSLRESQLCKNSKTSLLLFEKGGEGWFPNSHWHRLGGERWFPNSDNVPTAQRPRRK